MIEPQTAARIADVLHALGEPTRLRLIRQLLDAERGVNELAAAVAAPVVTVSHHLGVLLAAGVVGVERRGRFRIYSLSSAMFRRRAANGPAAFEFAGCRVVLNGEPAGKRKK